MVRNVGLVVVGLCFSACGKGGEASPAASKSNGPPAAAESVANAAQTPEPAASEPSEPALPNIPTIEPLELEAVVISHEFDFLGWTKDGLSFVLQQRYFDNLDGNLANGDELILELRNVYDSLTGALLRSYRVRRSSGKTAIDEGAKAAWKRAQPGKHSPLPILSSRASRASRRPMDGR